MVKADIIRKVAEKTGVPRAVVSRVLEAILAEIVSSVASHDTVIIRGFGSFCSKKCRMRTGRNFANGTTIEIPERSVPIFIPSDSFKQIVEESV